jgi:antitoxin (DNA-binding transcriptional repressor) of toxin-antitoxin stability system
MTAHLVRVGVREFRDELARYLESDAPLAITRHGQTVGYYIPARAPRDEKELDALRRGVEHLEALLNEQGVSVEEILREFRARRARR